MAVLERLTFEATLMSLIGKSRSATNCKCPEENFLAFCRKFRHSCISHKVSCQIFVKVVRNKPEEVDDAV
jgi:hypothetical protein